MTTAITVNQFYWRLIEFLFMTRFLDDRQEVFFWHISKLPIKSSNVSSSFCTDNFVYFWHWVCLLFVTKGDRQITGRQRGLEHDFSEVVCLWMEKNMQMIPSWHWEVTTYIVDICHCTAILIQVLVSIFYATYNFL